MAKRALLPFLVGLVALSLSEALADRGLLFVGRPTISVHEPGQKAIVAWNKGTEVMILATDARAPEEGKALGIIPLPSVPKVEKGSTNSFLSVQRLIWRHAPRLTGFKGWTRAGPTDRGVRVVFHKKIGAHHITVVEARSPSAFVKWAEEFVRKHAETSLGKLPPQWASVVKDYIERDIRFFVFDLIEVGRETKTVEPLVYTFKSRRPFYPLKISRPMGGLTTVQVFLLTPKMPDVFTMQGPLSVAAYRLPFGWRPILFRVSHDELKEISPQVERLFGKEGAFFCALEYRGPVAGLLSDFKLTGFLRSVALTLGMRSQGRVDICRG